MLAQSERGASSDAESGQRDENSNRAKGREKRIEENARPVKLKTSIAVCHARTTGTWSSSSWASVHNTRLGLGVALRPVE